MDAASPASSCDSTHMTMSTNPPYPSPPPQSEAGNSPAPSDHTSKKKRKAWGQPVPEIKQILPPRKRAKTDAEKEQRKNERILRNRRAADKSRQRQKAAVADLEVRQVRIEQENASLRELLARYESRFGKQTDFPIPAEAEPYMDMDLLTSTPQDTKSTPAPSLYDASPYQSADLEPSQPTLVQSDSSNLLKHESPALAPELNLISEHSEAAQSESMSCLSSFPHVSGLTQYPAVILCDLQCQPETWAIKLPAVSSDQISQVGLSYLLQVLQTLTIFQTFSTTTLWPLCKIFQILAQKLSTTSTDQDFSSIVTNFPLIHSLISMPSTPTRPAVFRMKLLSRLLTCSPHMARLLLAATDRALQQVVSEDGFAEDAARRWTWSSLMTIKWGIIRLEREHRKIRRQVSATGTGHGSSELNVMAGVDYTAVARSSTLWQGVNPTCNITTMRDEVLTTVQAAY